MSAETYDGPITALGINGTTLFVSGDAATVARLLSNAVRDSQAMRQHLLLTLQRVVAGNPIPRPGELTETQWWHDGEVAVNPQLVAIIAELRR